MKARLGVLALAAICVAGFVVAWMLTRDDDAAEVADPPRARRESSREIEPLATGAARGPVDGAQRNDVEAKSAVGARRVAVRSSLGLALPAVRVTAGDAETVEVPLANGVADLGRFGDATVELGAIGHVRAPVDARATEIVLEPDASLIVTAPNLQALVTSVRLDHGVPEIDARIATQELNGFVDTDRFAIAAAESAHEVDFALALVTGHELRVAWRPVSGHHDVYVVHLPDLSPLGAPTPVIVLPRDAPISATHDVELHLFNLSKNADGKETRTLLQDRPAWGFVNVEVPLVDVRRHLDSLPTSIELDAVPTGLRYALTLIDHASGAFGRAFFVHTGAPVEVPLVAPWTLFGRFEVEPQLGVAPPDQASFAGSLATPERSKPGDELDDGWYFDRWSCALSPQGAFEFRFPPDVTPRDDAAFPPPRVAKLRIDVSGFARRTIHLTLPDPGRVDLGTIRLDPKGHVIVVRGGARLHDQGVLWSLAHFRVDDRPMTARVVDDALIANGDLALFVKPVEGGPFDFESRFPPRLVQRLADGAQALTLLGMNVYDLEPQREFELRFPKVTATNARTHLAIGWTWNGIDVDQGGDVFEPGTTRAFSAKLTAPDGAQLWWDFGDGKFEAPAHRQPLASPVTVIDDP